MVWVLLLTFLYFFFLLKKLECIIANFCSFVNKRKLYICYTSLVRINDWLIKNTELLNKAGVGSARLDCLVLLEDSLHKERSWILANPETEIDKTTLEKLDVQIKQRSKNIPLAQVRSKTEFYGREFIITKDTLEPRPESETMIDLLKALKLPKKPKMADVGSGSGAIGITAAIEIPSSVVDFIEIDKNALEINKQNAKKHAVKGTFWASDLFSGNPTKYEVLLANLPYVPDHYVINEAALNEPQIAIFGGEDGLDLYRRMFSTLNGKPKYILTESLPFQHQELADIAEEYGYKLLKTDDFIQCFVPV